MKRILRRDKETKFVAQFERLRKYDEEIQAKTEEIAPWLIDSKTSKVYKLWVFLLAFLLQVELFLTPVILAWPEFMISVNFVLWALDGFWLLSIGLQAITIRPETDTRDSI